MAATALGDVAFGEVAPDLDPPGAQDVEPVRHGALPGHGLAGRVRDLLQVFGDEARSSAVSE